MTNQLLGIEAFLRSWDTMPHDASSFPIQRGASGHRNITGGPEAPAVTFGMWHPQFVESLEDGVRDLVLTLIRHFGCVTYSSCEGHVSADGRAVQCGRHVAMLSRDPAEHERLRTRLEAAIQKLTTPTRFVALLVIEKVLETDVSEMQCLDLDFVPRTSRPEEYFEELELVYGDLIRQIPNC